MHIPYTCGLLTAANDQRHGFLKLRGIRADHEVHLMEDAGLVSATFSSDEQGAFASINRVLPAGQDFLRLHKGGHPVAPEPRDSALSESQLRTVAKWKNKLQSSFLVVLPLELRAA